MPAQIVAGNMTSSAIVIAVRLKRTKPPSFLATEVMNHAMKSNERE